MSANSRFSRAPRGFKRISYHLMELLQMGLVPIQVYLDIFWLPYADFFAAEQIDFATDLDGLDALLLQLQSLTDAEIRRRERRIVKLRHSHFTVEGALRQIRKFMMTTTTPTTQIMRGGTIASDGDLRCQALPGSTRSL